MVTYSEVTQRHSLYGAGVIAVVMLAEYTLALTLLLGGLLAAVRWHMQTPIGFSALTCLGGPVGASLCVTLSHNTWWYAHGLPLVGVPPWLPFVHGVFAHWILDAYWLVTLTEVRKTTLP